MKKLFLIAMVMLGVAITANAQNANRSGFFVELSPGIYVGNTPIIELEIKQEGNVTEICEKSLFGLNIEFDAGYRWAFARHWALDAKVGVSLSPSQISNLFCIEILPGLRYTSKEFGSSNVSLFVGFNVGLGLQYYDFFYAYAMCAYELKAGFNLTNKVSVGFVWNALSNLRGKNSCHTGALGINLGYRF